MTFHSARAYEQLEKTSIQMLRMMDSTQMKGL